MFYMFHIFPLDDEVCPSSVSNYLHGRGFKCEECILSKSVNIHKDVQLPLIYSQRATASDDNVGNLEFFEWQGALSLGVTMCVDIF